ncbi:MAG: small multi-drug export protein [Candidatus Woesearchaeota archaeon]
MITEILKLIFITLIPGLELRASIPYGILKAEMYWLIVFLICVTVNIILGVAVYFVLDKFIHLFFRFNWFNKLYHRIVERAQKKVHPYIEKYGTLGLSVFIGIPLPGSGVYTGAFGAYLLGMGYKRFITASIIGVLIAGILVTIATFTGNGLWSMFVKM